jgi:hypothetical protein
MNEVNSSSISPTQKSGGTVNHAEKLWDEITKSIAEKMPAQFLPLIKEEFGKEYPAGTSVTLLSTESITPPKKPDVHMSHILSDLVLLIGNRNLYHFECEVNLDKEMVIRMIEYDFHTALTHNIFPEDPTILTRGNCIKGAAALHSLHLAPICPARNKIFQRRIRQAS